MESREITITIGAVLTVVIATFIGNIIWASVVNHAWASAWASAFERSFFQLLAAGIIIFISAKTIKTMQ